MAFVKATASNVATGTDAEVYSMSVRPQYEMWRALTEELHLTKGEKVLDMGCGTGDITKLVSEIVGIEGKVVGVDPDEARINFAQEKYKSIPNMKFFNGDSSNGFPYHNKQYYDYHVSTNAYHWLTNEEKLLYLRKAFECLKPEK